MEELKTLITNYFKLNNKITYGTLKKNLNIKGEKQTEIFNMALNSLVEDGSLFLNSKHEYTILKHSNLVQGKIEVNKNGTGFVHIDDKTIIIENHNLNGAWDKDIVLIDSIFIDNNEYKGKVKQIIKRINDEIIFKVDKVNENIVLNPYNTKNKIKIHVNKYKLTNLNIGDYVLVKVDTSKIGDKYKAEILNIIGNTNELNIDIRLLATEYNIPIEFSEEAILEAKKLPKKVSENEIKNRIDLRNKNIFTIDCDDTKDRDDAVGIEKLENGNFKLYVNISDVSHYVKKGSALYNEALQRNTSHYLNNTCIPMFPIQLSNGICSLNENVDRLTKTCEMEIDKNGYVVNYQIYKSIINSNKAMKYSEINKLLDGENEHLNEYFKYKDDLQLMQELSEILEIQKEKRNYLNFNIPDIKIEQKDNGEIIKFKTDRNGKAQKIIENFMVITNTTIAQHYSWFPFIYRIHEVPNESFTNKIVQIAKDAGIKIKNLNSINEYNLNNILKEINEKDKYDIFKNHLLQCMKRAKYDIHNCGHFALQLNDYCHFTSPIRRIADFIIHSIIDELETFDFNDNDKINSLEYELDQICKNASMAEKTDFDMEKEAMAMAMAEYMEKHIGEGFNAHITEIFQNGMFVKTEDNIIGKVKINNIYDDKYYYDYNRNAIIGKRNKKTYKIGDKVFVIAKDASKANRTINFEIDKQKVLTKNKLIHI